ncbi:MAG: hypothetical protein J2P23_00310 [Microlunatus sp.]|nr:hypothetical protein [Microlunatus sp.]
MDVAERSTLARELLSRGIQPPDLELAPEVALLPRELARTRLHIDFPAGLAPAPQPIVPGPSPDAALPHADVVVITWTVDENNALADVLTPGYGRAAWYRYAKDFQTKYKPFIRGGAPALAAGRMGSYMPTIVGDLSVLCMKSELHLNQDGTRNVGAEPLPAGTATLPVRDFFDQIIDEVDPKVILTVGTSGSVYEQFTLGDAVISRAGKFRLASEFRNEAFNGKVYKSDWKIPTDHFDTATALMAPFSAQLQEPAFAPPTKRYHYDGGLIPTDPDIPTIRIEQGGRDMPEFHPILTTDYFEFGTSANRLDREGCAVEMGDAVLGMAVDARGGWPKWAAVRNMSDPQINGDLPTDGPMDLQAEFAVAYYTNYGYTTSVTGALATWGILAGLATAGLPAA